MANKKYEETDVQAIAIAIREKTETDNTYNIQEMASGVNEVYEAGKQAEYDEFWDKFQRNGNRTDYTYAFYRWSDEYIRPKYKVIPRSETITDGTVADTSRYYSFISGCPNLKKIEKEYFDLSQYYNENSYNEGSTYGNYYTFSNNPNLEEIEDVGMQPYAYYNTFRWCKKLHTIEVIRSNENTTFNQMVFHDTPNLQNIRIEGVIGKNFSVQYSPLLSFASLKNIIFHLKNYTGTDSEYNYTLTVKNSSWTAFIEYELSDDDVSELFTIHPELESEFNRDLDSWEEIVTLYFKWNLVAAN